MSYPQPDSDKYAIKGYEFFRLNTLISSPGDIYESKQSGHAFAVGPESDIANVNIAYFDDQVADFVNGTIISPSRAFVGRLDARNETSYLPSKRPGRILFWSNDLYDPAFLPTGFSGLTDRLTFVTPRLDVIEYFQPLSSIAPERDDKTYQFQDFPTTIGGTFYLVIPTYGRKYTYCEITNKSGAPFNYGIVGVNFSITDHESTTANLHQRTTLQAVGAVADGASQINRITAENDGTFDVLVFSHSGGSPAPLRIVTSDKMP